MDLISSTQLNTSVRLGSLMQVLLNTERRTFKLLSIAVQTLTAVKLNQIYIMHNRRGEPVGYVIWAFVSDEVAAELSRDPNRILHYSEWNEGLNLWIMDFVSPTGQVRQLVTKLRNGILKQHQRVRGVRNRADGSIRKIIDIKLAPERTRRRSLRCANA